MGSYVAIKDIINALSPTTVLALFDDDNSGDINDAGVIAVVESVIARAEGEVNSYLVRAYPSLTFPVVQVTASQLLKQAALSFAIPFSYMRHPEYVRTYGDDPRGGLKAVDMARELMERLCTGVQFLSDVPAEVVPATVGGVVWSAGPRMLIDSIDGTYNGGDF